MFSYTVAYLSLVDEVGMPPQALVGEQGYFPECIVGELDHKISFIGQSSVFLH